MCNLYFQAYSILITSQDYWAAHDESGEYPHELHKDLAKDGWIGIALPEDLGGSGLGISEATMMLHTISEYATFSLYDKRSLNNA